MTHSTRSLRLRALSGLEILEDRLTPVTFGSPYGYFLNGSNTTAVAAGDINGDGNPDIVASNFAGGTAPLLNDGTGALTAQVSVPISDPRSLSLADINGDGKTDIVAAAGANLQVVMALGNGDGTFQPLIGANVGGGAQDAVVADFNGDGRLDVAVASGNLVVLMNNGSAGILGAPTKYTTGTDAYSVAVGDFNGDGKPDVALSGYSTDRVDVLLNNGDGTFGAATSYPLPWHGGSIQTGDLNHDGRDDIVVQLAGSQGVDVLVANPNGTFQPPVRLMSTYTFGRIALGDLDLDGNPDLVASYGTDKLAVALGNGAGGFSTPQIVSSGFYPSDVALADVNRDGLPDLIASSSTSPGIVTVTPSVAPVLTSFTVTAVSASAAGQGFDVTVTAKDASSSTIGSYTGTVHFSSTDPLAVAGYGLPADYTFTLDDHGVHTFHNVILKTAGSITITIQDTVKTTATGSTTVSVSPAAAAIVTPVSGDGQTATVGTAFGSPLVVLVTDQYGNPVPGAVVTFTGPGSGAGVTFPAGSTATTGTDGTASVAVAAGTTAGEYVVTATAPGVSPPASFTLTNTATSALVIGGAPNGTALVYDTVPGTPGVYSTTPTASLTPFGTTWAGIRTAAADVNGDGTPDTIMVTGPGTPTRVAVVSGTDNSTVLVAPFSPFGEFFIGGGFVAGGTFDSSGRAQIVVTPDLGGGPRVSIYSLATDGTLVNRANFFGIDDPLFRGGVRPAVGDVNGDGTPDLVVAAGYGGGSRVAIFDGQTVLSGTPTKLVNDFYAFPNVDASTLVTGLYVAAGDIDGDGFADLIFGGGPDGGAHVLALSGQKVAAGDVAGAQAAPVADFSVSGDWTHWGGVRVAAVDADGDSRADLVVGSGPGSAAKVRVYLGKNVTGAGEPTTFQDLTVFGGATLYDGVYVG